MSLSRAVISFVPCVLRYGLLKTARARLSRYARSHARSVLGTFLLDLLNPGTKPRDYFSLEFCLVVLPLQLLDGVPISV